MYVYKITNKINNKIYIGKTTKSVEERFAKHRYNSADGNTHLYKSMRKYGVHNFDISIIEECVSDLDEREIFWIQTLSPEYNMTSGGEGGDTSSSPNYKDAMIKHHRNRTTYPGARMLGKTHTIETKSKQSTKRKEYWDNLSEDDREKRTRKISGGKNGMFGKTPKNSVLVTFDGVLYKSITAAAKATGHSAHYIKKHGVLHNE
jgi:group I intron endonuclease